MRASTVWAHVPLLCLASLVSTDAADLRTGAAAFGDWQTDAPGSPPSYQGVGPASPEDRYG